MITREELLRMRNMTFDEINPDEVPDIDDLDIDVTKSKREKILEVLESGRNPYFVKSSRKNRICFYQPYYRRSTGKPCADEVVTREKNRSFVNDCRVDRVKNLWYDDGV